MLWCHVFAAAEREKDSRSFPLVWKWREAMDRAFVYRLNAKTVDCPLDTFLLYYCCCQSDQFWMDGSAETEPPPSRCKSAVLFVQWPEGEEWRRNDMEAECKPRRRESQQSPPPQRTKGQGKKKKTTTEKPHMNKQTPPPAWEGGAVLGGGRNRTVRSDPPPSARRPPTHGVKMGEKGMFS